LEKKPKGNPGDQAIDEHGHDDILP